MVIVNNDCVHQHFNVAGSRPARFISATNRMYKYMGYHDLEQIEDAPEA